MIIKEKELSIKNQMIAASYTAWQMGSGEKKSFGSYLKYLGLSEKEEKLSKEQKKMVVQEARTISQRIIDMDKPRKKNKK